MALNCFKEARVWNRATSKVMMPLTRLIGLEVTLTACELAYLSNLHENFVEIIWRRSLSSDSNGDNGFALSYHNGAFYPPVGNHIQKDQIFASLTVFQRDSRGLCPFESQELQNTQAGRCRGRGPIR